MHNQNVRNSTNVKQSEIQGLVVRNSHSIQVTQTEVQGLFLVQAALQAAIEASILVLSASEDKNVQQLQKIVQTLDVNQMQNQSMLIEDSGEITVTRSSSNKSIG